MKPGFVDATLDIPFFPPEGFFCPALLIDGAGHLYIALCVFMLVYCDQQVVGTVVDYACHNVFDVEKLEKQLPVSSVELKEMAHPVQQGHSIEHCCRDSMAHSEI